MSDAIAEEIQHKYHGKKTSFSMPEGTKRHQLVVPLTDKEWDALTAALQFEGKIKSRLVRELLINWLDDYYSVEKKD